MLSATSCGRSVSSEPPASPETTPEAKPAVQAEPARSGPVGFEMRNVQFRAAPNVILQVKSLRGRLVSRISGPPVFDDQRSFHIDVDGAEMTLDAASVTALVNDVFAYDGSPLSDLEVQLRGGRVEQKGKLRRGLPIPFSVEASVEASEGLVRLHPVKTRAAGIPATKLLDVFGVELDDLIRVRAGRGITVRDNDLFLSPSQMLPSPAVRGQVSAAAVRGERLSLILGDPAVASARPSAPRENYIWFRGGEIRFGRLTMTDTDLRLIDADPRDPFDFYAEQYNDQLVAGYSRNTPSGALRTYMPDYGDLPRGRLPSPRSVGGARRGGGL
jgi:hypothetical protein